MQMNEIMARITSACAAHGATRTVLFGSRAKGTSTDRSDIDIAVSGVRDIGALREALDEIPTLYTIDLVDMDTCTNDLLMEDIERYGHQIHESV